MLFRDYEMLVVLGFPVLNFEAQSLEFGRAMTHYLYVIPAKAGIHLITITKTKR